MIRKVSNSLRFNFILICVVFVVSCSSSDETTNKEEQKAEDEIYVFMLDQRRERPAGTAGEATVCGSPTLGYRITREEGTRLVSLSFRRGGDRSRGVGGRGTAGAGDS